jgi:2-hydroxy-6-oxonona-2,4-dienedioate hydrolase
MMRFRRSGVWLALFLASATSLVAQALEPKQVEVYGEKISYFEAGSGPSVILLHGMGANKNQWRSTIPVLAAQFHVYAPDQIGFGTSDKPMINYRIATLVDFLGEFMGKLGISKATLVGNSMGGWVAADFAIKHPAAVDRLALVDAAGYGTRSVTREQLAFLNPATLDDARTCLMRVFANKAFVNDMTVQMFFTDRMRAGDQYTIERMIDSVVRSEDFLNGRFGGIKAPTIVIWGRGDELLPVAEGEAMAKQIPGARTVIIDNCGHAPQIECPQPFQAALIEFLTETSEK